MFLWPLSFTHCHMDTLRDTRIYVAGRCGLVGGAIWGELQRRGFTRLIGRKHAELDLLDSSRLFALGWLPQVDLESGIRLAYQDFLKRFGRKLL